jgi:hypothetical protein
VAEIFRIIIRYSSEIAKTSNKGKIILNLKNKGKKSTERQIQKRCSNSYSKKQIPVMIRVLFAIMVWCGVRGAINE